MDFLSDLNPQQLEAVTHTEGPLLILAGAGSGKTRVIAYRIAYLISERAVSPDQILAVTFTNKAAHEMKNRVLQLLGDQARRVWISTFHSACVRILRQEIQHLGYRKDFGILDAADQMGYIAECVRELNINQDLYNPKEIARQISWLKNRMISPQAYAGRSQPFGFEDKVARVYSHYQSRLKASNSLDFDDLLMIAVSLLEMKGDVLRGYRERFHYVMIDEYQDTNHAQYRLVKLLGAGGNVCVVGDDDQSIYGFRGADLGNILHFEKDYPQARVIHLEQNYRSTQTILDAAGVVVRKNRKRKAKQLWTQNPKGTCVSVCQVTDEEAEARYIGKTIKDLTAKKDLHYTDFAILYRTHAQSRALEEGMRDEGIPYRIIGGLRFYERKEVKDLLAYLKVIINPADDLSLKRILNVPPRGIGPGAVEMLESCARAQNIPLSRAMAEVLDQGGLTSVQKKGLMQLTELFAEFRHLSGTTSISELLGIILKRAGYEQMLHEEIQRGVAKGESQSRLENIQELLAAARIFEERLATSCEDSPLSAFLEHVALMTETEPEGEGSVEKKDSGYRGAVSLMTLHNAKGLEFSGVFMAGMEEGLFPHQSALTDADEMEEERRLCYVGMTRAKERLYMVYADRRRLYGSDQWRDPSRFIEEIPDALVRRISLDETGVGSVSGQQESRPSRVLEDRPPMGPFKVGLQVRHPLWGVGRIQVAEGQGEDQRVVVHFKSVGTKKLAVNYARLEKVDPGV